MIVSMPPTAPRSSPATSALGISSKAPAYVTVATNVGVPRLMARGWLGGAPSVVVCFGYADLTRTRRLNTRRTWTGYPR